MRTFPQIVLAAHLKEQLKELLPLDKKSVSSFN